MRKRIRLCILSQLLAVTMLLVTPGISGTDAQVQAASVTCKSKYYVTMKISKNKLKKGQKAKVTIKISNSSGKVMNGLKIRPTLPTELKRVKGTLNRNKSSLKAKKSCSYSFYVQARQNVTFYKNVITKRKVSGLTTKIYAYGLIKNKKKKKRYMKVAFSFSKPKATTQKKPATTPAAPAAAIPTAATTAATAPTVTTVTTGSLSQVKTFMALLNPENYSDRETYLAALANTNYDLIFIDLFHDPDEDPLTPAEVNSLKKKKDGTARLVCAYFSVGEAENYRDYWKESWNNNPPSWIGNENLPDWPGNYKVEYWNTEWQKLLFGSKDSYLDRILAAGFDGVYLDVIDAYEYYEEGKEQPSTPVPAVYGTTNDKYGLAMADLLSKMSIYAKSKNSRFAMISNGGYNLYGPQAPTQAKMFSALDGVLIEDVFHPENDDKKGMQDAIKEALKKGKKAFNIEYTSGHEAESQQLGSICYTGPDELDEIR